MAFDTLVEFLGAARLADVLLERRPDECQAIYSSLADPMRESVAHHIAQRAPSIASARHLSALTCEASFEALAGWVRSQSRDIATAAVDAIERLVFAYPRLAGPALDLYDSAHGDGVVGEDRWSRLLGTVGTPGAITRLRKLSGSDAVDERARLGDLDPAQHGGAEYATHMLHVALDARETGRTLTPTEAIGLARAGKFAMLAQLLESDQIPARSRADVLRALARPQTKSQRRFRRKVTAMLTASDR